MMHNAVYLTGMLFVATLSLYHACNIHYLVDRKHSIGDSMFFYAYYYIMLCMSFVNMFIIYNYSKAFNIVLLVNTSMK